MGHKPGIRKFNMADGRHLESREVPTTQFCIEIFAQNLAHGRQTMALRLISYYKQIQYGCGRHIGFCFGDIIQSPFEILYQI